MPPIAVELPDEAWIRVKGLRGGEVGGVVGAPKATSSAEGREARGGGEASTQDGDYALRLLEVYAEGFEVRGRETEGFGVGRHDAIDTSCWCFLAGSDIQKALSRRRERWLR